VNVSLAGRHLVGLAAALGLLGGAAALFGQVTAAPGGKHRPGIPQHSFAVNGLPDAAAASAIRLGTELMAQAAAACASTAFSGEQRVRWWGNGGLTADVIEVWHQPGGQLITGPAPSQIAAAGSQSAAVAAVDQDALALTRQQLALLQNNFLLRYAGSGTADGRPASIVQVLWPDGALAARFWLDDATGLPLRRELFSSSGWLVSDTSFTSLRVGLRQLARAPISAKPALQGMAQGSIEQGAEQLAWPQVAALRSAGWPLPKLLGGSLILVTARQLPSAQGRVIELTYSDGLSVISLFLQRGDLPGRLSDWHPASMAGRDLYVSNADGRILAWSARGYVYSMIADAPDVTVAHAVAELPQDRPEGLFARIGRGLKRIVSWANPFH
jgi:sigma-E factor negative regulatory protein RseB